MMKVMCMTNVRRHSEQPESINDTYVLKKDDSNVTPDSSNICTNDNQVDQNAAECVDERAALANLTLDTEENKTILKQLKKANASLTQELEKCKTNLDETNSAFIGEAIRLLALKDIEIKEGLKTKAYEISVLNQKHDELVKKSLLTRSQLEGYLKENTKVISDLKVKEEKDIDKMIEMDKQLKFLNEIVYTRNQSIQTIHMLAPKLRHIMNLPQIRKQAVRNTNVIAPGPSRNNPKHVSFQSPKEFVGSNDMVHNYYLEKAKKSAQLQKDKDVNGKPSMIDPARLPNTANGCKPKPRNWQASMSSRVSNKDVHLGEHRKQKPFLKFNDLQCPTCKKCLYSANHDECVLEYLSRLNPRASAQNKDAKSHKTTKRYMPVEKSSASKKPERQIPTGHRFSNKKTTTVPKKIMNPRSCLRWQLSGRILKTVGLRWVLIGKLFNSCTSKVESEPTHGSNVDIHHIHACKQTLGLSAGTSFNGQKQQRIDLNADALYNEKQENLRVWLLKLLISKKPVPECSDLAQQRQEMYVENVTLGLIPQEHKASDYDNSDPMPPRQNVVPSAEKTDSSQQGLEFLFSPLLEEYCNSTHGHAEDNNNDQAPNASFQEAEFINPFCTRVQEIGESSSRNIDNTDVHSFQPQSHDYRWTRDHPLEQVRGNPTMPVQTRRQLATNPKMSKGYAQEEGIDFEESFDTLLPASWKHSDLRCLTQHDMSFSQSIILERENAFLNVLLKDSIIWTIVTPLATKPKLDVDLSGEPVDQSDYRSKIGSLMYLTSSRPDLVQTHKLMCTYQARPTQSILKVVKKILSIPKSTINMGLWYPKDSGFELTAFSDADHAGCLDTRKSTSGGIQFLGDKLVSWMSKKQNCTAMSSAKAEYVALSASCAQVMWMRTQLQDYGFNIQTKKKLPLY
ncbi:hypothetical protein Tco_1360833 [Tanacetum coccineum]